MSDARLVGDLCPLCYRSVAGRAHRRFIDASLIVCDDPLLDPDFPRDRDSQEPLLMQLPYVDDAWLFGVACVHLMAVSRRQGEPIFNRFRERWPVGAALLLEADPIAAVLDHYRPLGLAAMRAACTWRIADVGADGYTGYPREAMRVLWERDLRERAADLKIEAWRRWRLWQMGVTDERE